MTPTQLKRIWLAWLRFKHRRRIADARARADEYVKAMGWDRG